MQGWGLQVFFWNFLQILSNFFFVLDFKLRSAWECGVCNQHLWAKLYQRLHASYQILLSTGNWVWMTQFLFFLRSPPVIGAPRTNSFSPLYTYNNCNNKIGQIGFFKNFGKKKESFLPLIYIWEKLTWWKCDSRPAFYWEPFIFI